MLSSVRGAVVRSIVAGRRCMASSSGSLAVTMDEKTGVATMSMNRRPVNSLNMEFLTEMTIALEKLDNDKTCRGLILTSSIPNVFSAGLDINEMVRPQPDRLAGFWRTFQGMWLQLYGSRLPVIAAANGHSPAGGCLLALSCDYRLMAPGFNIGLNETQLGILLPFWVAQTMTNAAGLRQTELCGKGLIINSEQALQCGIIDEIVPTDKIMERAREEMKSWLKIPDAARQITKTQLRKPLIDKLIARREEDTALFTDHTLKESTQQCLESYMQQLKAQKSKK